ncbi:MAG: alpha/beta hydrolase [Bacteroidia bacterium]
MKEGQPIRRSWMMDKKHIIICSRTISLPDKHLWKIVGSGIAAYVAAQNHPKGLILETPYTSMIKLSQHHYRWLPVKWLHKYPFSVSANLPAIDCPVSIIHGTLDRVIPVSHSRELVEKYPQKVTRYEEIQGGTHNDLSQYEPFRKFLLDVL